MLTLGDNVYQNGTASEFSSCYGPTWGRFKSRTRPTPGNHDYNTAGASGYFDYFNGAGNPTGAGDRSLGYYSFDLGAWHVVVLNSECETTTGLWLKGGCAAGSAQETWFKAGPRRPRDGGDQQHHRLLAQAALLVVHGAREQHAHAEFLAARLRRRGRSRAQRPLAQLRAVRADERDRGRGLHRVRRAGDRRRHRGCERPRVRDPAVDEPRAQHGNSRRPEVDAPSLRASSGSSSPCRARRSRTPEPGPCTDPPADGRFAYRAASPVRCHRDPRRSDRRADASSTRAAAAAG